MKVLPPVLDEGKIVPSPLAVQAKALLEDVSSLVAEHSTTVSAPLGSVTATFIGILIALSLYLPIS